jgi:MFS transporter, AAHS family, 4-hydroxybenzoate transporter
MRNCLMNLQKTVNITEWIDDAKVRGFHWGIYILCSLCLIMDGFDVQAMGYVGPALIPDWKITGTVFGQIISVGLLGVLLGSLTFSVVADRFGRRPILIMAAIFFSITTFLTGLASSVEQMYAIRLIAGFGLGGIMPNAMALVGEYSPKRVRVAAMMAVSAAFTAGAAVGGFIAAWLIPAYGWRYVFYFGGIVPMIGAIAMLIWLPESLQYLVLSGKSKDKVTRWLKRANPNAPTGSDVEYLVKEEKREGVPAKHLFREGRSGVTVMLWIIQFMNLLNLYFLASWVPTVVRGQGYTAQIAVLVGTATQVGGTIGSFGNSWFIGKFGFIRALAGSFAVACVSIAFIGQPFLSLSVLVAVVFIAGWGIIGGQPGINSLAAVYYPTYLRSTGIGWSLGIGRIGAIVGPYLGGLLLTLKWTPKEVFLLAAIPAFVSMVMTLGLGRIIKLPATEREPAVVAH